MRYFAIAILTMALWATPAMAQDFDSDTVNYDPYNGVGNVERVDSLQRQRIESACNTSDAGAVVRKLNAWLVRFTRGFGNEGSERGASWELHMAFLIEVGEFWNFLFQEILPKVDAKCSETRYDS